MKLYPALKSRMGLWDYYTVRVRLGDLVNEVNFATDVSEDKTLEDALQRQLNEGRSKKDIAKYLATRDDRFFNAIVVAALDGNPNFYNMKLEIEGDNMLNKMLKDQKMDDHFGVLSFDDSIKTFALDGQHRLAAIKSVLDPEDGEYYEPSLADETIAVVFVIPPKEMTERDFRKQYRNIFTALNRHAKPMDNAMKIIMDESDRFAIITRRLIQEYEPFQWREDGTPRIDTRKSGKNVSDKSSYLMNIVSLYDINKILIWNENLIADHGAKIKDELLQEIADEEEIDQLYSSLHAIWDGIRITFPDLITSNPADLRRHNHEYNDGFIDHFLAWPLGQENILAPITRQLLNKNKIVVANDSKKVAKALSPLAKIDWDLHHPLWKFFVLVTNPKNGNYVMRSEDRKAVMSIALSIVQWLVGLQDLSTDQIEELKVTWAAYLRPPQEDEVEDKIFEDLIVLRNEIISEL